MTITLPPAFVQSTRDREGAVASDWLQELPGRFDRLIREWALTQDGAPMHGYVGVVLPVRREREPMALKIGWPDAASRHEGDALRVWQGLGAVRLIQDEPADNALLLERLERRPRFADLAPTAAARAAGALTRTLTVAAPDWVRRVNTEVAGWPARLAEEDARLGHPVGTPTIERVRKMLEELTPSLSDSMIHHDLHPDNVLRRSTGDWVAIDPKVVAGDPEFGIAQWLWQPGVGIARRSDLDEHLALLCEAGGFDPVRSRGWVLVRAVEYWLWAVKVGLTEDPERCRRLVEWV